jgi:complexin-1/2
VGVKVLEARREEEERRRQKYARMEVEREKTRQGIRDKYKIEKKKEAPAMPQLSDNALNRPKKLVMVNPEDDG